MTLFGSPSAISSSTRLCCCVSVLKRSATLCALQGPTGHLSGLEQSTGGYRRAARSRRGSCSRRRKELEDLALDGVALPPAVREVRRGHPFGALGSAERLHEFDGGKGAGVNGFDRVRP